MIQYGLNTFVWSSPFQTKDLHFLDHGKALGLDLVEIPIESIGDSISPRARKRTRGPAWLAASAP